MLKDIFPISSKKSRWRKEGRLVVVHGGSVRTALVYHSPPPILETAHHLLCTCIIIPLALLLESLIAVAFPSMSSVAFAHRHLTKWLLVLTLPGTRLEFSRVVGPAFRVPSSNTPSHDALDYTLSRAQMMQCLAIPYSGALSFTRYPCMSAVGVAACCRLLAW